MGEDRRVRRTRQALQRAMLELILEKGFEATHVAEITERADVGRSTFYAHYADKEDLLQGSIEELGHFLRGHLEAALERSDAESHPALAFCRPMLEHAAENRALFDAMVGRRSGVLFLEHTHDIWAQLVRDGWPEADEVAVQAIAGGFSAALRWWLENEPERGAAEIDRRFRALIEPALRG